MQWAVTPVILGVLGSLDSSRLPGPEPPRARVTQVTSVPPEASPTHEVSARSASAVAIAAEASGAHWIRTPQSTRPRLRASGSPTTRSVPSTRRRW
ncbi:hypothetical protein [Streptomyces luteoverticillatus]|uniref:hypothetical protein n=1 Tax=Streptomyces luteoverticillatus TaxID=66425 RepID=UPI001F0CD6FF|nr:hypothetical protein [Streptomyces luteoverticillatus]